MRAFSVEISEMTLSWHGYDGMIVKGPARMDGVLQVTMGAAWLKSCPATEATLRSLSAHRSRVNAGSRWSIRPRACPSLSYSVPPWKGRSP
jgi:hypothetical protein